MKIKNVYMKRNIKEKCDNHIMRSLNLEMYLQLVQKSTLSIFDDKGRYLIQNEKILWI